jgi:peptide-methionine (S)-S-oxide reductase
MLTPCTALSWRQLARLALVVLLALSIASILAQTPLAHAADPVMTIPAPAVDATVPGDGLETAVVAGGCFWGVQAVFAHVKGVTLAVSGYAGGTTVAPSYAAVSAGDTGHAESVQITFDSNVISYGKILQLFFSVAHNPTQLNYQGPDVGTQYRSAIFTTSAAQQHTAEAYIAQLSTAKVFKAPIVTAVSALNMFYPAEDSHQDYAFLHPTEPYIVHNDLPKVAYLQRMFADLYRNMPVLVRAKKAS